jgi:hypothetical protein
MKKEKQNGRKKLWIWLLALPVFVVLFFVVGLLIGLSGGGGTVTVPTKPTNAPVIAQVQLDKNPTMDLGSGLILRRTGSYSGEFMEDGSHDAVTNVQAILVENTSGKMLQYGAVTLVYEDHKAVFEISCLPAGAKVLVQEKNRAAYVSSAPKSASAAQTVFVTEEWGWEREFAMQGLEGALNIKNMTGKDINSDIYIYYRNAAGDVYYGGIVYRIRLEGGMKADEIRQIMADHFDPAGTKVVLIQYAPSGNM